MVLWFCTDHYFVVNFTKDNLSQIKNGYDGLEK